MDENVLSCIPVLQVKEARKSCEFYCSVLGFHKNWEHQFGPRFPLFISISRGSITLFLTEHPESSFGALVYFYVDDVDLLSNQLTSKGAAIDLGPVDQPWGVREVHLRDPDGNKLRFGQALARESEQIAQTGLGR